MSWYFKKHGREERQRRFFSFLGWLPAVLILLVYVGAFPAMILGIVKAIEFWKAQEDEEFRGAVGLAGTCLFGVAAMTVYWIKENKRMKELRKKQREGSVRHNIIG